MEKNETPEEAVFREVREEGGVDVKVIGEIKDHFTGDERARSLLRPMHLLLEKLNSEHEHMDLVYYATLGDDAVIKPQDGESGQFRWFSLEELGELDAPPNVPFIGKRAIEYVRLLR